MSNRHNKRRQRVSRPGARWGAALRYRLTIAHPRRAAFFAVLSLVFVWLVLTKSLPYVLATAAPDSALILNPNNPEALITKAESIRGKLVLLMNRKDDASAPGQASPNDGGKPANTLANLPEPNPRAAGAPKQGIEAETLRQQISKLALRAIANDPLNPEAYRLLGEITANPDQVRSLMLEAFKRSRRETIAVLWLLNDSFYRKDFKAAVEYADILLRTRPALSEYVFGYLAYISEDRAAREALVSRLASNPPWRHPFFQALPAMVAKGAAALEIASGLKSLGHAAQEKELAPLLIYLIGANRAGEAYNTWLQALPEAQLENLGILTNPYFETDPSGSPFDWRIERSLNARAFFESASEPGGKRFLHMTFGGGRVQFPEVSQVVILKPGHYRFEGMLRGTIEAARGLRWQLRCVATKGPVLGETEMLMGKSEEWRVFALEASVPSANCDGQLLRLFHDSRSASEELISGEIWFSGFRLAPLQAVAGK